MAGDTLTWKVDKACYRVGVQINWSFTSFNRIKMLIVLGSGCGSVASYARVLWFEPGLRQFFYNERICSGCWKDKNNGKRAPEWLIFEQLILFLIIIFI